MGILRSESPWVGQLMHEANLADAADDLEVVAIVRQERVLLPHPDTILQSADQLLVINSLEAWGKLRHHLAPFPA